MGRWEGGERRRGEGASGEDVVTGRGAGVGAHSLSPMVWGQHASCSRSNPCSSAFMAPQWSMQGRAPRAALTPGPGPAPQAPPWSTDTHLLLALLGATQQAHEDVQLAVVRHAAAGQGVLLLQLAASEHHALLLSGDACGARRAGGQAELKRPGGRAVQPWHHTIRIWQSTPLCDCLLK